MIHKPLRVLPVACSIRPITDGPTNPPNSPHMVTNARPAANALPLNRLDGNTKMIDCTTNSISAVRPISATNGQNAAQAAQYEALGYTPESAHDLILARFDYSFTGGALIVMILVIVAYYALMLKFSETEYREVISEKFGEK